MIAMPEPQDDIFGETAPKSVMTDDDQSLLILLQQAERLSIGYESDTIQDEQIKAFERYLGLPYGDEVSGRSQVHDRIIFETIEWLRPDLVRVFASGGNSVIVDPWEEGTEEAAQEATDYLNRLFFQDMKGKTIVDEFAFDGLLQKRGVGAVYWQDEELGEPEEQEVGQVEFFLLQQEGVHFLEVTPIPPPPAPEPDPVTGLDPMTGQPPMQPAPRAQVTFQRVKKRACPKVSIIAPEDFRIAARSTSLERPRYCGHTERVTKSDLREEFPDKLEEIEEYADTSAEAVDQDERRAVRFYDEDDYYKAEPAGDSEMGEVLLRREYLYHDRNGDGYAELLEIFRLDGVILRVQEVDDNPYFSWTPIPIPHRWFGLSIHDIAKDLQKANTTLWRGALDSVYLSIVPRVMANQDRVNLSDLLTVKPGAVIRVKALANEPVGGQVVPLVTPDMSGPALNMMEAQRQMGEARTGITRNAQGMDPDALNKTASGIKLMQNAASLRKEQFARNLGEGLEVMFQKIYRLVTRNLTKPVRQHAGKGKFKEYLPSSWAPEAKVWVHVGNGSGDRETQLGQLMAMQAGQKEFVAAFGIGNPIVTIQHMHNLQEDIGRVMGMRSIDQYFSDPATVDPEKLAPLTQPKPDPAAAKAEADKAAEMQKLQLTEETRRKQAELDHQYRMAELQLKREAMQEEYEFKRQQAEAELNLKAETIDKELAMKAATNQAGAVSTVNIGGEPG